MKWLTDPVLDAGHDTLPNPTTVNGRRLTPRGADRKAELVAAAEELFLERGYDNTRIADIAAKADTGKGLLYWYFPTKEALFREIIATARERVRAAMAAEAAPFTGDPLTQIYVASIAAVHYIIDHYRLFSLIYDVSQFRDAQAESAQVAATAVAAVITDGQDENQIRDGDPMLMAHFNAGVVNQAVAAFANGTPAEDAAPSAARYIIEAIATSHDEVDRVLREAQRRQKR